MRAFLTCLFFFFATTILLSQDIQREKVAADLLSAVEMVPGDFHSIHVVLTDQVDLTALDARLTAQRAAASQRSAAVITALREKAAQTQGELLAVLESLPGIRRGSAQAYWIANAILVEADASAVAALSRRSDVGWVGLNRPAVPVAAEKSSAPLPLSPNGREPGLGVIHAPALWAKGYSGYGRRIFIPDTGVDPHHPALGSHYRGLYVPGGQAWLELNPHSLLPVNSEPFDCQTHGTHVAGTVLGLDRLTNDTIGVAFNAQWMASPMLFVCGGNVNVPVAVLQWALDPDGDPATTDDVPDVINNSWGFNTSVQDSFPMPDCMSIYANIEAAIEAAGIAMVWSAGNEGPNPMTIGKPTNINLHEVSAFAVGALNGNSASLPIASFSSRGPSRCGGTGSLLIKPEVSAPGVNVRSSVPGGGYELYNGTSMAAPHVSGAILLLKEAFPDATGKALKLALYHTCTDLGEPGEDNTYGMGVIHVEAAYDYLVAQGHVPVPPSLTNDALLVHVNAPVFSCDLQVAPEITVENAGTDTLFSFDVAYQVGASADSWNWSGALAPGKRLVVALPSLSAAPGSFKLQVEIQNPNGLPDTRPLNNRLVKSVQVLARTHVSAQAEGPSGTVCENTPALLRAVYSGPETVRIAWYDAPVGGNKLQDGAVFVTPPLAHPATYFAEATYETRTGPADLGIGDTGLDNAIGLGLTLDVYAPFTLKSVKVFVESTGSRAITLRNNKGQTVHQKVVAFNTTGEVVVPLNWLIPPGNYSLIKFVGKPLFHNTTGATYPYSVQDILDITGTTDGLGASGVWYGFYDWQIEFAEPCGRTAVPVGVLPAGNAPQVAFTATPDSVDVSQQLPVQFTNATTGAAGAWHWNFGDGNASGAENPAHLYGAAGEFVVSLLAVGPDGCPAFALQTVRVTEQLLSQTGSGPKALHGVSVFPNPVSETLFVRLELDAPQPLLLELFDLTGRVLHRVALTSAQSDLHPLDLAGLPAGLYVLSVKTPAGTGLWKVVKGR